MAAVIGAVVAAGASYLNQEATNSANSANAQRQIDFQREMSNTSYQRAVRDLKAAGLSPMLAYSQGGASTPGGAMATHVNSAATAIESGVKAMGAGITNATIAKTEAETENVKADTEIKRAEMIDEDAEKGTMGDYLPKSYGSRLKNKQAAAAHYSAQKIIADTELSVQQREKVMKEIENVIATTANTDQATRNKRIEEILLKYEIPGARNIAKHQSDYEKYNVNVRPFLHDVGSMSHSASQLRRLFNR